MEPLAEADTEEGEDSSRAAEPAPWGRLMRLSGGSAVPLMPRPEQTQGRALNEVTLGRGKVGTGLGCSSRFVSRCYLGWVGLLAGLGSKRRLGAVMYDAGAVVSPVVVTRSCRHATRAFFHHPPQV